MPLPGLVYRTACTYRQDIGFAKLQRLGKLDTTEAAYGLGAWLFLVSYCLFKVPGNLILGKFLGQFLGWILGQTGGDRHGRELGRVRGAKHGAVTVKQEV